ncbi:MAG: type II toxin-antitoxin system RelE/ParE family toxin [Deltaproteobacteria bacterium]|nr:type II toxin-antitoxin system RelE/ParE family toxin [Deltaproteobacteria bacterium]
MSYTLVIQPQAEADIAEAHAWYEGRREGLGDDFLQELEAGLQRVLAAPLRHAVVHREVRRALTRRFPFAVFFLLDDERVVVLAILHQARDPDRWRRR